MGLFAVGNMLLKRVRARLPRTARATWTEVSLAFLAVVLALVGNVLLDPANLRVLAVYALLAGGVVGIMFLRLQILRGMLIVSRTVVERVTALNQWVRSWILRKIEEINDLTVVYLTKGDEVAVLNRAALYVLTNEHSNRLRVVHVFEHRAEIPAGLSQQLATIDRLYPRLRIDFLAVQGTFGPELIERLSRRLRVPKNYMFIGTPGDRFPHRIEELGGVRVIQ